MDLIDNYLNSVRPLLPGDQRDDILEELDGVLRGRVDEKAAELGRKLSNREIEAVLAAYGHPFMVAGRYGPQRTLIGPELYPLWWLGARVAVVIDVVVHLAGAVAMFMSAPESGNLGARLMSLWGDFWSLGFLMIGAVTVALAVVERFKLQPFGVWRAASTTGVGGPAAVGFGSRRGLGKSPSRVESGGAVIGSLFGIIFWAALPWIFDWGPPLFGRAVLFPFHSFELAGLSLGRIWFPTLWAMVLVSSGLQLVAHMAEFIRPSDRPAALLMRAVAAVVGAATAIVALTNGPLVIIDSAAGRPLSEVFRISQSVEIALGVIALAYVINFAWTLWTYFSLRRRAAAAQPRQSSGAVTG
jgi:hypothetical protein